MRTGRERREKSASNSSSFCRWWLSVTRDLFSGYAFDTFNRNDFFALVTVTNINNPNALGITSSHSDLVYVGTDNLPPIGHHHDLVPIAYQSQIHHVAIA